MNDRIECFMVERTTLAREYWRRWSRFEARTTTRDCSMGGEFHLARVVAADAVPFDSEWEGDGRNATPEELADSRFPQVCASCSAPFEPVENWPAGQNGSIAYRDLERLYRLPNGALVPFKEAPPGAMRLWKPPREWDFTGADGMELAVMLPDGTEWVPDRPASNSGTPWQRNGTPPKLTVTPSILTDKYHGFLTDGFLVSC